MTVLPSADHPASRAGLARGHREPAGKNKSGQTRPGNSHLKCAPAIAASGAAGYQRIPASSRTPAPDRPPRPLRTLVAIEHPILVATWHMPTHQVPHNDLGGDHHTR
jgi:hypothetical protein